MTKRAEVREAEALRDARVACYFDLWTAAIRALERLADARRLRLRKASVDALRDQAADVAAASAKSDSAEWTATAWSVWREAFAKDKDMLRRFREMGAK